MKTKSLGFIGGGRITKIFLNGLKESGFRGQKMVVFDVNPDTLRSLKIQFPEIEITENIREAAEMAYVFIALHPPVIMGTLENIKNTITPETIIISLAPKIPIIKIASELNTSEIVRMIPNATSFINEGYNPVTFSENFSQNKKHALLKLLKKLGKTFEVAEKKLEAYALVSAMLPTYFWFQWDVLCKLGKQFGLDEKESNNSVEKTLKAAVNLMFKSGLTIEQVMDLIPVKPIRDSEAEISRIYQSILPELFEKIKS